MVTLTVHDGLNRRVAGLDLDADDDLIKPFETRELLAGMRMVHRHRADTTTPNLIAGAIEQNIET